jgi:hypothetical protein
MARHRATVIALVLLVACALLTLPITFGSLLLSVFTAGAGLYLGLACLLTLVILAMLISLLRRYRRK